MRNKQKSLSDRAIGWAIRYAIKQLWRITPAYDLDDLIQDAHLVWLRCQRRYGGTFDEPHQFALFRTAYSRYIDTLARQRLTCKDLDDTYDVTMPDDAYTLLMIERGPLVLGQIIEALCKNTTMGQVKWHKRRASKLTPRPTVRDYLLSLGIHCSPGDLTALRHYLDKGI